MSSRNDSPKWSFDGKYIAFISDRSGRDEIWISESESRNPKKITDLDNEKGALVWTPDSKTLLYTAADKKLYSYSVTDAKTTVVTSTDLGRIGSVAVSPDSKWITFSKRTALAPKSTSAIGGGKSGHSEHCSTRNNAVGLPTTYIVFTSSEGPTAASQMIEYDYVIVGLSLRPDLTRRIATSQRGAGVGRRAARARTRGRERPRAGSLSSPHRLGGMARRAKDHVPGTTVAP